MTPFKTQWLDKSYFELTYNSWNKDLQNTGITIKEVNSEVYGLYDDHFEHQFIFDIPINDYIGNIEKPGTPATKGSSKGR